MKFSLRRPSGYLSRNRVDDLLDCRPRVFRLHTDPRIDSLVVRFIGRALVRWPLTEKYLPDCVPTSVGGLQDGGPLARVYQELLR